MTLTHDTTICIFDQDIDIQVIYWSDPDELIIHGFYWDKKLFTDKQNENIDAILNTDKQAIIFYNQILNL